MFLDKNFNYKENFEKIDLFPIFRNNLTSSISPTIAVKMTTENEVFSYDIALCEFLYNVRFATLEQINCFFEKYLKEHPRIVEEYNIGVDRSLRLGTLVYYRLINKFVISDSEKHGYPEDDKKLFSVYCLDIGGRGLIQNFTDKNVYDFSYADNIKDPTIVFKELVMTDFYLRLLDTNLTYFKKDLKVYSVGHYFDVGFKTTVNRPNGVPYTFFAEVIEHDFNVDKFVEKINQYELLLTTNSWKKYSREMPILLFICSDDETALTISDLIEKSSTIDRYRLTTYKRIENPLANGGTLLRYSNAILQEISSPYFVKGYEK